MRNRFAKPCHRLMFRVRNYLEPTAALLQAAPGRGRLPIDSRANGAVLSYSRYRNGKGWGWRLQVRAGLPDARRGLALWTPRRRFGMPIPHRPTTATKLSRAISAGIGYCAASATAE